MSSEKKMKLDDSEQVLDNVANVDLKSDEEINIQILERYFAKKFQINMQSLVKENENKKTLAIAQASVLTGENISLETKLGVSEEKVQMLQKMLDEELDNNMHVTCLSDKLRLTSEITQKDKFIASLNDKLKSQEKEMEMLEDLAKQNSRAETGEIENNYEIKKESEIELDELNKKLTFLENICILQENKIKELNIRTLLNEPKISDVIFIDSKTSDENTKYLKTPKKVIIDLKTPKKVTLEVKTQKNDNKNLKTPKRDLRTPKKVTLEMKTPKHDIKNLKMPKRNLKTPKKDIKNLKTPNKNEDVYDDIDPRHPTSSVNLRLKGRTQRGKRKLEPMGALVEYTNESVKDIIINKGETSRGGERQLYFVLRTRTEKKLRNRSNIKRFI